MARYTGPVCRLCRRQGEKLMLKGERCLSSKCPLERRHSPPGHTQRFRPAKLSEYGIRLMEKQRVRHIYSVMERQLRRYFAEAEKRPGLTGENLLKILEMRLDNVIYRLGFADSRRQARQLVRHGHFMVNGHKVDIPSCLVKPGEVIVWRKGEEELFPYQKAIQDIQSKRIPSWLNVDTETLNARVLAEPSRDDIDATINERLIVEYYSR